MYGYGTGDGDVGVREGANLRQKTLMCGGGDAEDDIVREERGRRENGGEKDRKAVRKEGEGKGGKGGRRERGEVR